MVIGLQNHKPVIARHFSTLILKTGGCQPRYLSGQVSSNQHHQPKPRGQARREYGNTDFFIASYKLGVPDLLYSTPFFDRNPGVKFRDGCFFPLCLRHHQPATGLIIRINTSRQG